FFSTMQIPILAGREIEDRDLPGSPVVGVINKLFAQANFGNENPIGRHLLVGDPRTRVLDVEIVGVSGNARYGVIRQDMPPIVFIPYSQVRPSVTQMNFALRTAGDPRTHFSTVREIVRQADPLVPISYLQTQDAQIDRTINQEIVFARLCTG